MPIDGQHGAVEAGQRLAGPGVQLLRAAHAVTGDALLQAVPAAHAVQADQRQRQQRCDDHEELQHLVVDRGGEAADGDVEQHERGGDARDPPTCGQPSRRFTIMASSYRFTPAISSWATAKLIEFTRCAPVPKRMRMNSGTERTLEP